MTRRDLNALAALVADDSTTVRPCDCADDMRVVPIRDLMLRLADLCQTLNGRFDRNRFLRACLGLQPTSTRQPRRRRA